MAIGDDLHLDVAGVTNVRLQIQAVVAEGGLGLRSCLPVYRREVAGPVDGLHPLSSAPGSRFQQDWVSDLIGHSFRIREIADHFGAGHHGNAQPGHCFPRGQLVAHGADMPGTRADEDEPVVQAGLREFGPLGKEPVARMNRIGATAESGLHHGSYIEIAGRRRGRPNTQHPVGHGRRQGADVDGRCGKHRFYAQRPACANHADGDFAPVGNEHTSDGGHFAESPSVRFGFEQEEDLAVFDQLPILHRDAGYPSSLLRLDGAEQLHNLDDADGRLLVDHGPHLHERRLAGRRSPVKRAEHRGGDADPLASLRRILGLEGLFPWWVRLLLQLAR